jgi:hypothetical protein
VCPGSQRALQQGQVHVALTEARDPSGLIREIPNWGPAEPNPPRPDGPFDNTFGRLPGGGCGLICPPSARERQDQAMDDFFAAAQRRQMEQYKAAQAQAADRAEQQNAESSSVDSHVHEVSAARERLFLYIESDAFKSRPDQFIADEGPYPDGSSYHFNVTRVPGEAVIPGAQSWGIDFYTGTIDMKTPYLTRVVPAIGVVLWWFGRGVFTGPVPTPTPPGPRRT